LLGIILYLGSILKVAMLAFIGQGR